MFACFVPGVFGRSRLQNIYCYVVFLFGARLMRDLQSYADLSSGHVYAGADLGHDVSLSKR
jgi:hypothetical protein